MLTIRLFRIGKINQPVFKIVVTEKTNPPKSGRFIEELGFYNPITKEKNFNKDRIQHWIKNGAQPSDTLYNLLVSEKIVEGKKKVITIRKKSIEQGTPAATTSVPATVPLTAEIKPIEPVIEPKKEETVPEKEQEGPKETVAPAETPVIDTN